MWKLFVVTLIATLLLIPPTAESQTTWFKYAGNPAMSRGPSGAWDDFVVIPRVHMEG